MEDQAAATNKHHQVMVSKHLPDAAGFGGKEMVQLVMIVLLLLDIQQVSGMATLAPMWAEYRNATDPRSPYRNSYSMCIVQAGTLGPVCLGTFPTVGNTYPPSGESLLALSSGAYFTCGLLYGSNRPICWGDKNSSAVPFSFRGTRYSSISSGGFHVCALRSRDGEVDCWGDNLFGQRDPPFGNRFTYISSGGGFSCGLTEYGEARCWGAETRDVPLPVNIRFRAIFAGGYHVCGIEKNTGKTFCWGANHYNQSSPPVQHTFSVIASGRFHSCGLVNNTGKVACWGDDSFNQVRDAPRDEAFSSIAAGDYYTCGVSLKELQSVRCWGNSIVYTLTNVKVSQGLCVGRECSKEQFPLLDSAVGFKQCPNAEDNICLDYCADRCIASANRPWNGFTAGFAVPPGQSQHQNNNKKKAGAIVWIGILGGSLVAAAAAVMAYLIFRFWGRRRAPHIEAWKSLANRLVSFSSSEVMVATRNYNSDMILGKGGFGVVYKGLLSNGQAIAIKKSQIADDKTMVRELEMLSRLHHSNLVNLIGYCAEEKLLAYEFMENGSLYDCLFKRPDLKLDWPRRIQIAAQAARGLEYLHIYASPQILHRDVKAANILLDKDWNAHISDFGLSLLKPPAIATHASFMTVVGTPGYVDPEYFQTLHFSAKSDVYSFGVVLLELITGRHALEAQRSLASWALSKIEDSGNSFSARIFDPRLHLGGHALRTSLHELLGLALQCTSSVLADRPSMTTVANTLEQLLGVVLNTCSVAGSSTLLSSNTGTTSSMAPSNDSMVEHSSDASTITPR